MKFKLFIMLLLASLLSGCAEMDKLFQQDNSPPIDFTIEPDQIEQAKTQGTASIQEHLFQLNAKDSLVGRIGIVPLREGDTLLDIARHFGLGYQHITEANPDLDIWVPEQGAHAILPLQFILPDAKRAGVVINLATMRLFYFHGGKQPALSTWPIGIGREGRSTPLGAMAVARKMQHPTWYVPASIRKTHEQQGDPLPPVVPPGPDNPLGDFALYLSKPSYLVHGTNKPFSIGLRASNGCIRLYPEDIERAFKEIPVSTPILIVNQPYLLGWLDGVLYLEAHQPHEEVDAKFLEKNLMDKLQSIAKQTPRKIDWPKVAETLKYSRGIPTPIFENTPSLKDILAQAVVLERPEKLFGQPEPTQAGSNTSWFIQTMESQDEFRAKKLAAELNHLGPRIPARTIDKNLHYQVIAGPFAEEQSARKAQRILTEDFNTHSELVKPLKTEVAKTATNGGLKPIKGVNLKPSKSEPPKPDKGVSIKPDKPVGKKPPAIILKLPKPDTL